MSYGPWKSEMVLNRSGHIISFITVPDRKLAVKTTYFNDNDTSHRTDEARSV